MYDFLKKNIEIPQIKSKYNQNRPLETITTSACVKLRESKFFGLSVSLPIVHF